MFNSLQLYPTDFSRGKKSFAGGFKPPLRSPGYGPGCDWRERKHPHTGRES